MMPRLIGFEIVNYILARWRLGMFWSRKTCFLIMSWHSTHKNRVAGVRGLCSKVTTQLVSFLSTSGKKTLLTMTISNTLTCNYLCKQEVQHNFVQYEQILQTHTNFALIHRWSCCCRPIGGCVLSVSPGNILDIRNAFTFPLAGVLVRKDQFEFLISGLKPLLLKGIIHQRLNSLTLQLSKTANK